MVRASASAFMCATISTSPGRRIGGDAGHEPVCVELRREGAGPPSACVEPAAVLRQVQRSTAAGRGAHQRDEPHLLARIVAERAGELRRDRRRAGLLHAAHRHAGMLGLHHHGDAARPQDLVDRGRDLRRQVLLRLQPACIDVDQPRDLGQADHALDRQVGDVRLAGERHHVVLAVRRERDVPDEDEVVVGPDLGEGAVEDARPGIRDSRGTVPHRRSTTRSGVSSRPSRLGSSPA